MGTFYVSPSGSGTGVGSPGDPFTHDQAAVRANAGDLLNYVPGLHLAGVSWTGTGAYRAIGDVSGGTVTIRANANNLTIFKTLAAYCEVGGFKIDGNGYSGIAFWTDDNTGPCGYVHDMWITGYVGSSGVHNTRLSSAYSRGERLAYTNVTASNAGQLYLGENRQPAILRDIYMAGVTSDVANLFAGGGNLRNMVFSGCFGAAIAVISSGSANTLGLIRDVTLYASGSINFTNVRNRVTVIKNILAYRPSGTPATVFANAWGTGTPAHLSDLVEDIYYGGSSYSGLGLTSGTVTTANVNVITADPFTNAAAGDFSLSVYGRALRYAATSPSQAGYTGYRYPGAVWPGLVAAQRITLGGGYT